MLQQHSDNYEYVTLLQSWKVTELKRMKTFRVQTTTFFADLVGECWTCFEYLLQWKQKE